MSNLFAMLPANPVPTVGIALPGLPWLMVVLAAMAAMAAAFAAHAAEAKWSLRPCPLCGHLRWELAHR